MDIELEYRERIDAMSASERIRRAEALFNWSRDYLVRSIVASKGPMSERDLRWELALRQYGTDPQSRAWINELQRHAPC